MNNLITQRNIDIVVDMMDKRIILGFAGPAGVGKTTTSEWFRTRLDFCRLSFADPIKKALVAFTGLPMRFFTHEDLKEIEIKGLPGITPRIMMQRLGTEYAREMINPDYFLWYMKQAFEEKGKIINIVIDDVRFDNEADLIRSSGGRIIHLVRDFESSTNQTEHKSEVPIFIKSDDIVMNCLESPEATAESLADAMGIQFDWKTKRAIM